MEGRDWEELCGDYEEMSRAAGVRQPNESLKAKALRKMKAARDSGEDFCDPERKENIFGKK